MEDVIYGKYSYAFIAKIKCAVITEGDMMRQEQGLPKLLYHWCINLKCEIFSSLHVSSLALKSDQKYKDFKA